MRPASRAPPLPRTPESRTTAPECPARAAPRARHNRGPRQPRPPQKKHPRSALERRPSLCPVPRAPSHVPRAPTDRRKKTDPPEKAGRVGIAEENKKRRVWKVTTAPRGAAASTAFFYRSREKSHVSKCCPALQHYATECRCSAGRQRHPAPRHEGPKPPDAQRRNRHQMTDMSRIRH